MSNPLEREQALRAYISSPRPSERHAPLPVIQLSKALRMPVWELYQLSNHQSRHYRLVRIPKKNGDFRELHVPDEPLKQVQEAILHTVLRGYPPAESATAYHPGASLLQNAAPHVGKPLVLKTDIAGFFDSITYPMVRAKVFPNSSFPAPAAAMLTSLCTLDDQLPQGAPTSPAIANLVMKAFDETIEAWCAPQEISYTRYCDDMTFSGYFPPKKVLNKLREELSRLGMELREEKTRSLPYWRSQRVTGVAVNQRPRMPADSRRALRQELYYCRKFGPQSHLERRGTAVYQRQDGAGPSGACPGGACPGGACPGGACPGGAWDVPLFLRSLLGKVSFALQLDPGDLEMQGYRQWLMKELNP